MVYEVGDRLYWFDLIAYDENGHDVPKNAPERYATVTSVNDAGDVCIEFDDGLEDMYPSVNVQDFFERVTWDSDKP